MKGSVFKRCPCPKAELRRGKNGQVLACKKDHGTWWYRLEATPDPETGRRRRPSQGGFRTREEALEALSAKVEEVTAGTWTDDQRQTISQYMDRWLERKASSLKATTLDTYRTHIDKYIRPHLGRYKLRELRPEHIYRMLEVVADGRSPAMVHRVRSTLRSALATAVKERMLSWNPARDLEMPKERNHQVTPWSPEETGAFLDAISEHRLSGMFQVMAYCGLRRGEALGLRWDDVDLVRRVINIRQQIVHTNAGRAETVCEHCGEVHRAIKFELPKTDDSVGQVHLDAVTVSTLLTQQLKQGEERQAWGDAYADHGLVFARENGSPLDPNAVSKLFQELLEGLEVELPDKDGEVRRTSLRKIRLHDLRHGAASLMIAAGVDIAVVSKVLRHSTIKLTVDSYGHLLPGVGESAAESRANLIPRKDRNATVGHTSATFSPEK